MPVCPKDLRTGAHDGRKNVSDVGCVLTNACAYTRGVSEASAWPSGLRPRAPEPRQQLLVMVPSVALTDGSTTDG
jgi:hypothetical protein